MNEIITNPAAQRRVAAGLSPALLAHAAQGQKFLGFISYRRRNGLALAKWLRDRITEFQPPIELKGKIDAIDASVGGKQNRVFLDMSYQRPNVDFWDEHIAASLCRSSTLLLLQTPSVFERLDNGEPNWCEREIETYLKYYDDPSRILVVMAPGAPIDRFPDPLAAISARWDWIDLRFFSESPVQRLRHGGQYDPLLAKILAKIYDISDGDLPLLNREFAKARARVRRALAIAACTVIVSLSALTAWALMERDRATAAEKVAVEQRDTAIRQRNAALIAQSRFLAKAADEQSNAGSARAAVAILREALPDPATGRDRPLVTEAVASAYRAIYDNREMGRLPMPPGATAVASDGHAGRIVIATRDRLIIRTGVDTAPVKEWAHDFGATESLALAGTGSRVVMTAADGSVMVRDLSDNRVLLRNAGAGRGTRAVFLQEGARLLVSDADQRTLQLFDLDDGALLATRKLQARGKPVFSYADGGFLAVIAGAKLMRLSNDDLTTVASIDVPDMSEYAFALSLDRTQLFVAAAERAAFGTVLSVDASTLALQHKFGRLAFGAKSMAVSPTRDLLAINTSSGVDFFDTKKFETIGHVTTVPLSGGRFLKDGFFYIGYNPYGDIVQIVPEILTTTAYKTIDGGGIRQIDVLADGTGFLSLSDRPSITRWAFDPNTSSLRMTVPFKVGNVDLKMPLTIAASDFSKSDNSLLAAYFNGVVKRWNLEDDTSKTIKDADPETGRAYPAIAALGNGIALIAQPSGMLQIYAESAGSSAPLTQIEAGPVTTLLALSPTSAFVVAKGEPELLDLHDAAHPKLNLLAKLGHCPRSGGGADIAICVDTDGTLRALRVSDDTLVADLPRPAGGLNAALVTEGGQAILVADTKGNVEWRHGGDGTLVRKWALRGTLKGALLAIALTRGLLSPADAAAVRAGSTSVDIPMSPVQFEANADQTQIAAVMPNGAIKLMAPQDGKVVDIPARDGRFVSSVKFSAKGHYLAVIDYLDDAKSVGAMLVVYDAAAGIRMFAINCDPELVPTVHALADGRGFVTVNPRGNILVHPVFDQPLEFIGYLAEKFAIPLTPEQRKFFFIE